MVAPVHALWNLKNTPQHLLFRVHLVAPPLLGQGAQPEHLQTGADFRVVMAVEGVQVEVHRGVGAGELGDIGTEAIREVLPENL